MSHESLPPGTEQGRGRQKDSGRSTAMAKVTQSGQEDQAPMPRLALSSTPPNQLPVRLSTCGLRIPQRLCVRGRGAGLRVGGRAFRKLRTDGHGRSLSLRALVPASATPTRPSSLPHLDPVLVNFLIRDLPGTVPPHLGDGGLVLEAVVQAEGRDHVLEPLGAGDGESRSDRGGRPSFQGRQVPGARRGWGGVPQGHAFQSETNADAAADSEAASPLNPLTVPPRRLPWARLSPPRYGRSHRAPSCRAWCYAARNKPSTAPGLHGAHAPLRDKQGQRFSEGPGMRPDGRGRRLS